MNAVVRLHLVSLDGQVKSLAHLTLKTPPAKRHLQSAICELSDISLKPPPENDCKFFAISIREATYPQPLSEKELPTYKFVNLPTNLYTESVANHHPLIIYYREISTILHTSFKEL